MLIRHVVLVTYGEPPTAAFGAQLTYSWRILVGLTRTVAPIPAALVPLIAIARARARSRLWSREAYRSPLEPITRAQADRLRDELIAESGSPDWRVHVAYEFRRPLVAEALATIPGDEPIVVVPMYAADSTFTHALSREVVRRLSPGRAAPADVLPALDAERLAEVSAAHVLGELDGHSDRLGPNVALVLAAHGTVLKPPRPIDTGLNDTTRLCEAIARRLGPSFGLVVSGWLNHSRGGPWTVPPIEEALQRAAGAGFSRAVYYPYGFLADNAESQLEGRLALRGQPGLDALQVPCLNESPRLAGALAGLVLSAAHGWPN